MKTFILSLILIFSLTSTAFSKDIETKVFNSKNGLYFGSSYSNSTLFYTSSTLNSDTNSSSKGIDLTLGYRVKLSDNYGWFVSPEFSFSRLFTSPTGYYYSGTNLSAADFTGIQIKKNIFLLGGKFGYQFSKFNITLLSYGLSLVGYETSSVSGGYKSQTSTGNYFGQGIGYFVKNNIEIKADYRILYNYNKEEGSSYNNTAISQVLLGANFYIN